MNPPNKPVAAFEQQPSDDLSLKTLRFIWQAAARELLPDERVAQCLRVLAPHRSRVDVVASAGTAGYRNLIVCSRLWHCPVCAARISEHRRKTISGQLDRLPYVPIMLTYTLRHSREDNLGDLLKLLSDARKRFRGGKAFKKRVARYGFVASVRGLEVTHGTNGWHVHVHELQLLDHDLRGAWGDMTADLKERWFNVVSRVGGSASFERGLDVTADRENIGEYVSKIGRDDFAAASRWKIEHEVVSGVVKLARGENRTPNQLLHDYSFYGDTEAGEVWREYAQTFKGRMQLFPSSFHKLIGEEEVPEESVPDEVDQTAALLASINYIDWQKVLRHKQRGQLLEIARQNDFEALADFLKTFGVYPIRPE